MRAASSAGATLPRAAARSARRRRGRRARASCDRIATALELRTSRPAAGDRTKATRMRPAGPFDRRVAGDARRRVGVGEVDGGDRASAAAVGARASFRRAAAREEQAAERPGDIGPPRRRRQPSGLGERFARRRRAAPCGGRGRANAEPTEAEASGARSAGRRRAVRGLDAVRAVDVACSNAHAARAEPEGRGCATRRGERAPTR